jgi:glycosyltransferase involved in cell wall biosynthesis
VSLNILRFLIRAYHHRPSEESSDGGVPKHFSARVVGYTFVGFTFWSTPSTMQSKVCYIIPSLRAGGAEGQLTTLLGRIDRSRFTPTLVTFESSENPPHGVVGVTPYLIPVGAGENSQWLKKLAPLTSGLSKLIKLFRQLNPDIVHSFLPAAVVLGTPAAKLAGHAITIYSRRSLASAYAGGFSARADRFATGITDRVVGNSRAVTEDLVAHGISRNRTTTIPNGVDTDRFHPSISPELRTRLRWNGSNVVVSYVANFHPIKRHRDLLHAAKALVSRYPACRFVLAGADRGELANVRNLVATLQLDGVVHLELNCSAPELVYAASDIVVSTSESEGMSNVLLEAMACGKPIVATNVGGNPEAIVEGETGFLVPPMLPDLLAQTIERLINAPGLRDQMAIAARLRAESQFSLARMVSAYEDLYEEVLHRS